MDPETTAPPIEKVMGVYLVRITLRGTGETEEPTLAEVEKLVEEPFADLGWAVNASAERADT